MKKETVINFPKKLFGLFPLGWKNYGKVGDFYRIENGETIINTKVCKNCNIRVNHAEENGIHFWFCPKCYSIYKIIINPTNKE